MVNLLRQLLWISTYVQGLLAIVAHIRLPPVYLNIFFSVATRPIQLELYMKHPIVRQCKLTMCSWPHDINCCHVQMHIREKNRQKSSSTEPTGYGPWALVCSIGDVGSKMYCRLTFDCLRLSQICF